MAIRLQDKTNTDGPTTAYLYGKIRDDSGSGDGTPVNTEVYGDHHQFFARLMAVVGASYNNLPENNTNGFQYVNALISLIQATIYGNPGGSWSNMTGLTFTAVGGGSITVGAVLAKSQTLGRTRIIRMLLSNITITGTVNQIRFTAFPASSIAWTMPNMMTLDVLWGEQTPAPYGGETPCSARLLSTTTQVEIARQDFQPFGTGPQHCLTINIIAEVA